MKRVIKATTISDKSLDAIYTQFGSTRPETGCSYIAKDGTFINIYPKLDVHEDLCWWVEDELNEQLDYEDEEYFIRECGWIRTRKDPHMAYIELPSTRPTAGQWVSIQDWLEYCEESFAHPFTLDISVIDDISAVNTPYEIGDGIFSEDILKILKRYYSSGKLYSSEELDSTLASIVGGCGCCCNKAVHLMTYNDVLRELKRCLLKNDQKRMRELSLSQWYDKALADLRRCMGICATDEIDDSDYNEEMSKVECNNDLYGRYDVISQGSYWYITEVETGDIYEGPFDTKTEALLYLNGDEEDDEYYEEEEFMTDEEMLAVQHEKFLNWFEKYASRLPGKVFIDGYIGTRNYSALKRFVDAFNKSHPDAQIEIDEKVDSDGDIYVAV